MNGTVSALPDQSFKVDNEYRIGFSVSAVLHTLLFLGLLSIGKNLQLPETDDQKTPASYWVKIEKLAIQSQAEQPNEVQEQLLLNGTKPLEQRVASKLAEPSNNKQHEKAILTKVERAQSAEAPDTANQIQAQSVNKISHSGTAPYSAASAQGSLRASYEQAILQKLEQVKNYPQRALSRRLEGNVLLYLNLAATGEVLASKIEDSSGFDLFDQEVLAMVARVGTFPAFPAELTAKSLALQVPVSFKLRG